MLTDDNLDGVSPITVYNGSKLCPKCGGLMGPTDSMFSGNTGLCAHCRNVMYAKQAKSAMSMER